MNKRDRDPSIYTQRHGKESGPSKKKKPYSAVPSFTTDNDEQKLPEIVSYSGIVENRIETLYGFPFNTSKAKRLLKSQTTFTEVNKRYISLSDVDVDAHDIIIIKSPMGSGKTTLFLDLIKNVERILIVSSRRSYSDFICSVIPGLVNYQDITGPISASIHQKLVLQVQSLSRIKGIFEGTIHAQWQVMFVDEFDGVCKETISEVTERSKRHDFSKLLRKLISTIPKVIIADASLAVWHLQLLETHLLSDLYFKKKVCLINSYKPKRHKVRVFDECLLSYSTFDNKFSRRLRESLGENSCLVDIEFFMMKKRGSVAEGLFLKEVNEMYKTHFSNPLETTGDIGHHLLQTILTTKENVIVICNTKSQAFLIHKFLSSKIDPKHLCMFTGETDTATRTEMCHNLGFFLRNTRVFIYTSAFKVGVDINFEMFSRMYIFVDSLHTNYTPPLIDIFQCAGRSRKTLEMNLYVYGRRQLPQYWKSLKTSPTTARECHMEYVLGNKMDASTPDDLLEPGSVIEPNHRVLWGDEMDNFVYCMNKMEREFNSCSRLFSDAFLRLLEQTTTDNVEYREPGTFDCGKFLMDNESVKQCCANMFEDKITRYTALTMDCFNDIFAAETKTERRAVLKDIVRILKFFDGSMSSNIFIVRHINPDLLKQWCIRYNKFQFFEPTEPVNMANFDKEIICLIKPETYVKRVINQLFRINKASYIKTEDDFEWVIATISSMLDFKETLTEFPKDGLERLSLLLVNEYEIATSTKTIIHNISKACGLVMNCDYCPEFIRLIMPTQKVDVDIHKMAALLLV